MKYKKGAEFSNYFNEVCKKSFKHQILKTG